METAAAGPRTVACPLGSLETVVPVRSGQGILGFLRTGHALPLPPTESDFKQVCKLVSGMGVKIPRRKLREAYFGQPVVSRKKMKALSKLLEIFADQLAEQSNQISLQQNRAELPAIARAREFIRQHHREKLSLDLVAGAVHTNRFYFCKVFKRETGLTFTAYLSRQRIATATHLLTNSNLRVSEIAFEVGFQSLTHFNLVFHRIVGESPTKFRSHLPVVRRPVTFCALAESSALVIKPPAAGLAPGVIPRMKYPWINQPSPLISP